MVMVPLVLLLDGAEDVLIVILIIFIPLILYFKLCMIVTRLRDIGMSVYWSAAYLALTILVLPIGLGATISLGFTPSAQELRTKRAAALREEK